MKILDLSDSNILRMVLFNRISWFSPTESIKNWFSPTQLSPEWFCYEYSADWICRAESFCRLILSSRILQTDSVKQNHSADWFCSTESFCRIFLAESFCCADWVSRIFSAEWFCWFNLPSRIILLRIFCRLILSSRIILQSDSARQNHSAEYS